ncbi:MAG: hypothetical protein WCO02_07620 [Bacteroidota bacterium]
MKIASQTAQRHYPAIYLSFFSIGMVETLFPRLNWQISMVFADAYLVRILTFLGLLLLSFLSVAFGLSGQVKTFSGKIAGGLLTIVPGLLILLFFGKSVNGILFSALFLFSGSLFVQVASLQHIIPGTESKYIFKRIAWLYLLKSAGLAAGMCVPFMFPSVFQANSTLSIYLPLVFICTAIAMLLIIPLATPMANVPEQPTGFSLRAVISDKLLILLAGGLLLYSGAEFCLKDIFPFYFSETFGLRILQTGVPGIGLFFLSFLAGRLAWVFLPSGIKPGMVFMLSSLLCISGIAAIYMGQLSLSLAATVITGLGMAGIFPVLLAIMFDRVQLSARVLAGLMIATIPPGEFFSSLMWAVTDSISIAMGFIVPMFCMFFITWIAITLMWQDRERGM